jgi:hypothetical protein
MKRLVFTAFAAVALLLPATAAAKGPSEAKLSGPGLSSTLTITGDGEGDTATDLGLLVQETGFFPQVYGQSPNPLLQVKPTGLGPRYTVVYTVPGPTTSTLEQGLYPYAAGGPVSYMRPRQRFWGTQFTLGGWYRGTSALKGMLVKAGLPQTAYAAHRRTGGTRVVGVAAAAGVVLAGAALALARRYRR